jgi:uncharacterized BrkB/YihY/UPF0761 family membrane protein
MQKTWKPTTAGILSIISGAISALGAIGLIIALSAVNTWTFIQDMVPPEDLPFVAPIISTILIILLILNIIEAVFPILGGVYAVQRRKWGWALAGAIIAIIGVFPLGILATIFVSMAKDEFEQAQ